MEIERLRIENEQLRAENDRLRKQCVFLRDRSAEGQQLLKRTMAHIDTAQSLYKEIHEYLYPPPAAEAVEAAGGDDA